MPTVEGRKVDLARLTPRQRDVWEFMRCFQGQYGFPPSRREIAEALGLASMTGATMHVLGIAAKGFAKVVNRGNHHRYVAIDPRSKEQHSAASPRSK